AGRPPAPAPPPASPSSAASDDPAVHSIDRPREGHVPVPFPALATVAGVGLLPGGPVRVAPVPLELHEDLPALVLVGPGEATDGAVEAADDRRPEGPEAAVGPEDAPRVGRPIEEPQRHALDRLAVERGHRVGLDVAAAAEDRPELHGAL